MQLVRGRELVGNCLLRSRSQPGHSALCRLHDQRRMREALQQKYRTLPSGERYEHLRAVADADVGMHALIELGMTMCR